MYVYQQNSFAYIYRNAYLKKINKFQSKFYFILSFCESCFWNKEL